MIYEKRNLLLSFVYDLKKKMGGSFNEISLIQNYTYPILHIKTINKIKRILIKNRTLSSIWCDILYYT